MLISEAQGKRLYAIAKGAEWTDEEFSDWLQTNYGYKHSREIPRRQYEAIVDAVRGGQ